MIMSRRQQVREHEERCRISEKRHISQLDPASASPRLSPAPQISSFTERVALHSQDASGGQIRGYMSEACRDKESHPGNGSNRSVRMEP